MVNALDADFQSRLDALMRDAQAQGHNIGIGSGYRTPERQAQLYQEAVEKYGSEAEARKHVAPPGHSFHNKGLAADLSYSSPEAQRWVAANAGNYGLHFPMSYENWHVEPFGTRGGSQNALPGGATVANSLASPHIGAEASTQPFQSANALSTYRPQQASLGYFAPMSVHFKDIAGNEV